MDIQVPHLSHVLRIMVIRGGGGYAFDSHQRKYQTAAVNGPIRFKAMLDAITQAEDALGFTVTVSRPTRQAILHSQGH